jgi:hypothetical protein
MSRDLRQLIERQIAKAVAEGKLSGLEGEGNRCRTGPARRWLTPQLP